MSDYPPIQPDSMGYWTHRVWNVHQALIKKRMEPFGLTASEGIILHVIAIKQPVPARDISQYLAVTAPAVARQVDALEKQGLVVRSGGDEDERVRIITLSPRGEKIWPEIREILDKTHKQGIQGLDPDVVLSLLHALKQVRQNLESHL